MAEKRNKYTKEFKIETVRKRLKVGRRRTGLKTLRVEGPWLSFLKVGSV